VLGAVLALGFAAFFASNSIIVRRGVFRVSANYIASMSVFAGPPFFFLLTLFTGDLFRIAGFSWKADLFFAISGVIHFAVGRTFGYRATQLLGANRSTAIVGLYALVSVVLAIIFLGEKITPLMIAGAVLSLSGPLLITWKEGQKTRNVQSKVEPHVTLDGKTLYLGVLFGVATAVLWGVSPIFIELGLDNGGTALGGAFIAFCAGSLAIFPTLLDRRNRKEIFTTIPLWTITLSFIFNRKIESFSRWVFVGNGLLIVGAVLVLL